MEVIEKEPSQEGYEFGRWSAKRLATYLEQKTGIKISGEQVRRILKEKKSEFDLIIIHRLNLLRLMRLMAYPHRLNIMYMRFVM
jgi:hypothetical protein